MMHHYCSVKFSLHLFSSIKTLYNILAEMLKNAPQKLYRMIVQLFTICIHKHTIPKEWKTAHITPIFKHGDRKKCDNYRAISVTSTFSRLFRRTVRDLTENEYSDKEAEEQAGFRAGRSCNDNTFVIKQLIEKQLSVGKEVHLLFIDFTKAYDNIPLIKLWKALEETGISYTLIKTVEELYRKSLSYIKLGGLLSEGFEVMKGLRQGCCISPTLFKISRISRPIRRTFFREKCDLNSTCVLCAEGKCYFQTYKYPYI
jgi:hypothetical protein